VHTPNNKDARLFRQQSHHAKNQVLRSQAVIFVTDRLPMEVLEEQQ
jgi:hypothetical protein